MSSQEIEVLVVGGGQAGIAMSEHLGLLGVQHLVLERDRIAERWRSWRWDSLVANGPAWHDKFPGQEFSIDPDGFASKDQVADYLVTYSEKIDAPIRTGVEVTSVRRNSGGPGFCVETSDGTIQARFVVAATGAFQRPIIPAVVPDSASTRFTPARIAIPNSCPREPSSLSAQARRVCRSPTNSSSRAARSIWRSGRMTGRREAIAAATSAGGWASSASGMLRRLLVAPST